jgi:hypothetical protein
MVGLPDTDLNFYPPYTRYMIRFRSNVVYMQVMSVPAKFSSSNGGYSLSFQLRKRSNPELIRQSKIVIFDEVHLASDTAKVLSKIFDIAAEDPNRALLGPKIK